MRIVFMGTPELAAQCLKALAQAGYELPLVVTQPDRPRGRGQKMVYSAVKAQALALGLEVFQPQTLRDEKAQAVLRQVGADVVVVAAFGQILPKAVLELPPLGCINVHGSLLPAYRGAAPIQWVLLNGEAETGVTIMKMAEGLDTGPMLLQKKLSIPPAMTGGMLYAALSQLGAEALLEALPLWAAGRLRAVEQQEELANYACRLNRSHEEIHWSRPAGDLLNQIRCFNPWPGAFTHYNQKEVKVLEATLVDTMPDEEGIPTGTILTVLRKVGPVVKTGGGALALTRLQPVGKQPMEGASFVNGYRLSPGQRLE